MAFILLMDDSKLSRAKYARLLTELGHQVETAEDGNDGLAKFHRFHPDLVMCDMDMPGKNGLEVVKEIISQDPGAIILVFSAVSEPALMKEALKAGAKNCLMKPVLKETLKESIEQSLRKH